VLTSKKWSSLRSRSIAADVAPPVPGACSNFAQQTEETLRHRHAHATKGAAAAAIFALAASPLLTANLQSAFASTNNVSSSIACTKTITGVNNAVINVAAPLTYCLVNLDQIGAVNVAPGAGLSVSGGSIINGAITLTAAKVFSFCASSTKQGAIVARRAAGPITIGNGGKNNIGCGPSHIDGATTLSGNLDGLEIGGNSIVGALTVSGNVTPKAAEIDGNTVMGLTTCANNTPPPVNDARKNTFTGGAKGQCVKL